MSVADTKLKVLISILFFSLFSMVQASNWYQLSENNSLPHFNGVSGDLHLLLAVGDNGAHFISENDGMDWQEESTGVTENLNGTAVASDGYYENPSYYEFAVGDNGRVLKSLVHSGVWQSFDTLGTENYNFAKYLWGYSRVYIGGENSQCYYTDNLGFNWVKAHLPSNDFNLLGVAADYSSTYLFAERNDTTFILTSQYGSGTFSIAFGDTLPNTKFVASAMGQGESSTLYYLLTNRTTGSSLVYERFNSYEPAYLTFEGNLGTPTDMDLYLKNNGEEYVIWITNLEGYIWESHTYGNSWFIGYQDPQQRELYHILTSDYDHDHGRAFGSGGLVLKYGFELTYIHPGPNMNMRSDFSQLELHFSLPPNLDSLESGIHLQSQQSGAIPFMLEQDPEDFRTIYLNLTDGDFPKQVPGDKWNVSFSNNLRADGDTLNELFDSFNYELPIVSQQATSFKFVDRYHSNYLGAITTNWATGLINQDKRPDLITFSRDTLFCYAALDTGGFQLYKVGLTTGVQLDINIKNQLLLSDVNTDGLPDVILYDSQNIRIYLNQSNATTIDFIGPTAEKNQRDIIKVLPYNANNNERVDLLILASSFYTQFDITPSDFGNYTQDVFNSIIHPQDAIVADLDNDNQQDLVLIDANGYLNMHHGHGFGNFDEYDDFQSGESGYKSVKIGDLNDDQLPEILASKINTVDMYGLNTPGSWNFYENSQLGLVDLGQQTVTDFYVQDFGGQRQDEKAAQMDILVLSSDSLRLYQNNTYPGTNPNLERLTYWTIENQNESNQILLSDYNRDDALDFTMCSLGYGSFSVFEKITWKPTIDNIWVADEAIHLTWDASPEDMGTVDYYKVFRDNNPNITQYSYVRTTNGTQFDDYEYDPFDSLYYAVQAVYTDGSESEISAPAYIAAFIELDGAITGVLSDTTREYLVRNAIWVPAGSSLEIQKGIRIGFREHARFDVYGALSVQGEWPDAMVDFFEADSLPWSGIYLAPAADTVHFNWFSVSGADTALAIDNRPFKAHLAGIIHNRMGLIARDDSLTLENVIFDSNMVAVELNSNEQALMKNVTILHSSVNSITVKENSRAHIRNAIIWDNYGGIQKEGASSGVDVAYSTVDLMQPGIVQYEISQLPPIFMPPDSGYYRCDYMSPTIDAGDPSDSFQDEPAPNGERINQGIFGGTSLATVSLQPRISMEQDTILLSTPIGSNDTSGVWIHNKGYIALHLNSVSLSGNSTTFQIVEHPASNIAPGDSSFISLGFFPTELGTYTDTLRIVCDDPHLINGLSEVKIVGQCKVDFVELDGPLTGVLSDTTQTYIVSHASWIPQGSSLEIQKGIRIGFREHARLDVYGAFTVQGEWPDDMVEFYSTDSLPWSGISLAAAADTVRFHWFSVSGADTAMTIDNRPVKARLGRFAENRLGLIARGDSLLLENVIFDSNMVAIEINSGEQALIKNATILHSSVNSITAKGNSRTHIRNAIIWDNNGQIQRDGSLASIRVKYSTVDHMQPLISHYAISQLPPIFMPPDSGYYRMDYNSPTIDAGDPSDSFQDEPAPNGERINQGVFGGTFLATISLQPRLETSKDNILLAARPGQTDTSGVWIRNKGFATLHLDSVFLAATAQPFHIIEYPVFDIEPGDSSLLTMGFFPGAEGEYRDTLRIMCNDPHLSNGWLDINVFGRCTYVTPVVKLLPLVKQNLKQAAIRFHFAVIDSGSGASNGKRSALSTYQLFTSMVHLENGDTIDAFRVDTSHVDYANLEDGTYRFKIWAVPVPGEPGEQNVKTQSFTVSAQEKDAIRNRWFMISLPTNYEADWDDFALADSSAYLLKWNNTEEQYDPVDMHHIPPGQGFWAFTFKKIHLDLSLLQSGTEGNSIQMAGEDGVELVEGWNQVGIPERYNLFWHEMQMLTAGSAEPIGLVEAAQSGLIDGAVHHYEHSAEFQGYVMDMVDSVTMAEPWRAYWIYANRAGTLYFPQDPAFASDTVGTHSAAGSTAGLAKVSASDWRLNLSLTNGSYWDEQNIIGISPDNRATIHEPPHMGDYCALYLPSEKGNLAQQLQKPFADNSEVKSWDLQMVTRKSGKTHTLNWDSKAIARSHIYLYFVDEQNETIVDMNKENGYTFTPKSGKTSFKIYATQDENFRPQIIPLTFTLKQNYPNPFNPETTIRFGVPASAKDAITSLTVYNVLGKKITVLFKGNLKMGYHEFKWNGKNTSGNNVASGIYFYQLKSGKTNIIKKMVLVR